MIARDALQSSVKTLEHLWHRLTRPVVRCVTWLTTDRPCPHCGHGLPPSLTAHRSCVECGTIWRMPREQGDPP
jgi:hypothetical protein